jgi:hypothetical protein
LGDVHRAPVIGALVVEPAFGEDLRLAACAVGLERGGS